MKSATTKPRRPRDEAYSKAAAAYGASYMSNAKWLRLFHAVIDADVDLPRTRMSFIHADHTIWKPFPRRTDLESCRFADASYHPFEYKWIESIFIPQEFRVREGVGYFRTQDVSAVEAAICAVGQFCLELDDLGLTIWAYGDRRGRE